jgi:hypothetical protein
MAIKSVNPFDDPNFKKEMLASEGVVSKVDEGDDFRSIISSAPKIPTSAKNMILDATAIVKNNKEAKVQEMTKALSQVFTEYNKEYGLDLNIDFSNLSRTLVNCANPETRRTLELYTSELFKSIKPLLLIHLIGKLSIAVDYVLQPEIMMSEQFSAADIFLMVEKLMQFIENLDGILKQASIPDSDKLLQKLAEEHENDTLNSDESKQAIEDFMKLFKKDNNM